MEIVECHPQCYYGRKWELQPTVAGHVFSNSHFITNDAAQDSTGALTRELSISKDCQTHQPLDTISR